MIASLFASEGRRQGEEVGHVQLGVAPLHQRPRLADVRPQRDVRPLRPLPQAQPQAAAEDPRTQPRAQPAPLLGHLRGGAAHLGVVPDADPVLRHPRPVQGPHARLCAGARPAVLHRDDRARVRRRRRRLPARQVEDLLPPGEGRLPRGAREHGHVGGGADARREDQRVRAEEEGATDRREVSRALRRDGALRQAAAGGEPDRRRRRRSRRRRRKRRRRSSSRRRRSRRSDRRPRPRSAGRRTRSGRRRRRRRRRSSRRRPPPPRPTRRRSSRRSSRRRTTPRRPRPRS